MNIVVNIRGTSGSGKTTVVRKFLELPHRVLTRPKPTQRNPNKQEVMGYEVDASSVGVTKPVYVIGSYENVCGGCDTIPTQQEAADRAVAAWGSGGHVLMEGLLASAAGMAGAVTMTLPKDHTVYGIMDTPLQTCVDRVMARRAARGETKPFNPANTEMKYQQTFSTAKSLYDNGYNVKTINGVSGFQDVVDILKYYETL